MNGSQHGSCVVSLPSSAPVHGPDFNGLYIAAEILISVLSMSGNILVCLAVSRNRRLRTVTNYFLVSLAVADIFVGLLAIPCAVLTDMGLPRHNLPLCLLLLSVLIVLTQSSILSLLAVAAERYVAILLPLQYQRIMCPRNARLALFLTWFLALLSGSLPLMGWHGSLPLSGSCLFTCVVDLTYMVYFNFFGCVLAPLAVMFVIYGHIFLTVRQQLRRIAAGRGPPGTGGVSGGAAARPEGPVAGTGDQSEDSVSRTEGWSVDGSGGVRIVGGAWYGAQPPGAGGGRWGWVSEGRAGTGGIESDPKSGSGVPTDPGSGAASGGEVRPGVATEAKRALRMRREVRKATSLFLVLFLFMLCWLPIHCVNCVLLLCPDCPVPRPLSQVAILLSHANSALNPLLYAYRMRSFRHTLKGLCHCHRCSREDGLANPKEDM